LKPTIFREYDIRGIAERDLPSDGVRELGQALGTHMLRNGGPRVALGRDVRKTGARLHGALLEGLLSTGCQVVDLGVVPTPLVYYATFHLNTDGAIQITGSHNPADYNGFKAMCAGKPVYGAAIQQLLAMIRSRDFASGAGSVSQADVAPAYIDEIAAQFRWDRRIKVVVDCGNGTAGPVIQPLLARLNCDVVELFHEPDGDFPNHHPDPTVEENLVHLKAAVAEHRADLGIAFDGDSDRIGAIDETGRVVWGDYLLLIYAREILSRKPGSTFIGEVKCSQVMYDELEKLGARAIMYKTGHSLIKAKMKEEHAELAGEMSGHMFFADRYYGYDDALYGALRLMEIVAASGRPLSAQLDGLPTMVSTPELRVDCPDEAKFEVIRRVAERFSATHRVITVDGVRVLFDDGWGLARASNTQPVIVMRFEAPDAGRRDRYRAQVEGEVERVRRELGV
jgi:phosphomannomutase/phosphoglucomutase